MLRVDHLWGRSFRLAIAFCLAVAIATAAAFAFVYLQVSAVEMRRLAAVLTEESEKSADDSQAALYEALRLRLTHDLRQLDYVALFDPSGAKALGNISDMPAIPVDGEAHIVPAEPLPGSTLREPAIFVARRRDDGVLVLGRSLQQTYDLQETVLEALALALAPTVLAILAIGAVFARREALRFERIHGAIVRIMNGELNLRLPASKEPEDEIDRVARAVNLMLDEIGVLLDQLKSIGDNIAHDLRTPLMAARSRLDRALQDHTDATTLHAAVDAALGQLDRASLTISAILRISAVENDTRKRPFLDVDLSAVCVEVFDLYEPLAQSKGLSFELKAAQPVVIRGDEDLMREAIANLVDNALKFTPPGGTVRIEAVTEGGTPLVTISDTGCGIPEPERDKVFARFYRSPHSGGVGNGLGLSIASTIAKLHGFRLTVEDNKPGARFEMRAAEKASLALEAIRG